MAKKVAKKVAKKAAKTAVTIELPCIDFQQGSQPLVFFHIKAKALWEIVSINQKIEDKDEGYQRSLSGSRVKAIAKYVDGNNTLPQSLLVSFDDGEIIKRDGKTFLKILKSKTAGWVIDGQHRLAGAYNATKDIDLPVLAFVGLSIQKQIQLFVTINQEAKGVPSSLYLDLLKNLPYKSPAEIGKESAANIGVELKKDEESPFYAKIVITTSPKRGEISLTNFVRKITPLILPGKGILQVYNQVEQRGIISNYYKGLRNVFSKEYNRVDSIFFQTLGFGALINALPTFFAICFREHKGFRVEDVTAVFKKIDYFDFSSWHSKGSGSGAEIESGMDLSSELNSMFEIGTGDDRKTIRL
jgi:DGQHR domain-containing protein